MRLLTSAISPVGSMYFCKTDTGLGNALFQIASIYGISKSLGIGCTFPRVAEYIAELNKFNYRHGETILRNVPTLTAATDSFDMISENIMNDGIAYNKTYNKDLVTYIQNATTNLMICGHLEDFKYFEHEFHSVREMFSCDDATRALLQERYGSILSGNTVAVHFRDYSKVNNPELDIVPEFYRRSIQYIKERVPNPLFLIFTDNKNCVDISIFSDCTYAFISNEVDYLDLYCMSFCKHAIISQSTFSWWACFLNESPNKIVVYDKKYTYNYLTMFTSI